jgi:hypothetical protein
MVRSATVSVVNRACPGHQLRYAVTALPVDDDQVYRVLGCLNDRWESARSALGVDHQEIGLCPRLYAADLAAPGSGQNVTRQAGDHHHEVLITKGPAEMIGGESCRR